MRRVVSAVVVAVLLSLGGAAVADAGTSSRPIDDGTTGCHKWVQYWWNGPWFCAY